MVHSALKRKRFREGGDQSTLGLTTPISTSSTSLLPDLSLVSAHFVPGISGPEMSTSTSAATPKYSFLPPAPFDDPFPIIRVLFDLLSPSEISNILKERINRLLTQWPPSLSPYTLAKADTSASPSSSPSSSLDRLKSKELSTGTVHAFLTFFRPEEFRTDGSGVTLQDLHTQLKALQTLLSFLSSRELKEIVQARLNIALSAQRERWIAVQGMLDVMGHTEDDPNNESRDIGVLGALVKAAVDKGNTHVDVGVCTTEQQDASNSILCNNGQSDPVSDDDLYGGGVRGPPHYTGDENLLCNDHHPPNSTSLSSTSHMNGQIRDTSMSPNRASRSTMSLVEANVNGAAPLSPVTVAEPATLESVPLRSNVAPLSVQTDRHSSFSSGSPWDSPQKERPHPGSSSGSSGLVVTRGLNSEQIEEWKSDIDAEGDTDMDMDMSDSEMIGDEHLSKLDANHVSAVRHGEIPGLSASQEMGPSPGTSIPRDFEKRLEKTPLSAEAQLSTDEHYTQPNLLNGQLGLAGQSHPIQIRASSLAPTSFDAEAQTELSCTNFANAEASRPFDSSSLQCQNPSLSLYPAQPNSRSSSTHDASVTPGDSNRWKPLNPALQQEPVPGLLHAVTSPCKSNSTPSNVPRGLRAASKSSLGRQPPTFVRAQQQSSSLTNSPDGSAGSSKDSSGAVNNPQDKPLTHVDEAMPLKVKEELMWAWVDIMSIPAGPYTFPGNKTWSVEKESTLANQRHRVMSNPYIPGPPSRVSMRSGSASQSVPTAPRSFTREDIPTGPRANINSRAGFLTQKVPPTSTVDIDSKACVRTGHELPAKPKGGLPPKKQGFNKARSDNLKPNNTNTQQKKPKFQRRNETRGRFVSRVSRSRSRSRSPSVSGKRRGVGSRSVSSSRSSRDQRRSPPLLSSQRRRSSRSSSRTSRSPVSMSKSPRPYRRRAYSYSRPVPPASGGKYQRWTPSMEQNRRETDSYQPGPSNTPRHDHWSPGGSMSRRNSHGDLRSRGRPSDVMARAMSQCSPSD